ncbi:nucleotidyltransferase family protein [Rubrivirga sp.]|uniref:nucleotidyltransferase domain-containing protein n=1 Tax=Rubrivirga sp. TaxID=1885344 RepID=UPI003B51CB37
MRRAVRAALLPVDVEGTSPEERLAPLGTREDQRAFVRLARRHGVAPLVLAGLRSLPRGPSPALARVLHRSVLRQGLWSMALRAELGRLAALLHEAGVPFVVLKGVALHDAYGALSLRPSVDNDILVRPEDFGTLEHVLVEAGYSREHRAPRQKKAYLFVHGQYTFRRQQGDHRLSVDAHTRVMPFGYRYSEDVSDLLRRGRTVLVDGVPVPVPSWEDLIVVLCTNGLKDLWTRLRLVADVVAVSAQVSDWDAVARLAERSGCRAQVVLGLCLAEELFGVPVPAPFASRSAGVDRLTRTLAGGLRGVAETPDLAGRVRLFLSAQDSVRSRLRYVLYTGLRRASEPFVRGTGSMTSDPDGPPRLPDTHRRDSTHGRQRSGPSGELGRGLGGGS